MSHADFFYPFWLLFLEEHNLFPLLADNHFFEILPIPREMLNVPKDVDILMLVHPKGLSTAMQYSIDQFVLRGGRVIAFIDNNAENTFDLIENFTLEKITAVCLEKEGK